MENKEKSAIQEMDETTKRREKEKLSAAVDVVNAAIRKYREELEKLYEGYALADVKPYFNEINGGYYLTVQMYKKPAPKRSRKRGHYERQ